jgi:hypothetical protein
MDMREKPERAFMADWLTVGSHAGDAKPYQAAPAEVPARGPGERHLFDCAKLLRTTRRILRITRLKFVSCNEMIRLSRLASYVVARRGAPARGSTLA